MNHTQIEEMAYHAGIEITFKAEEITAKYFVFSNAVAGTSRVGQEVEKSFKGNDRNKQAYDFCYNH